VRGKFVGLDTRDCIVVADRRIIGTVGVKDLVIVETENSVLVCHRDSAERVRDLVQEMDNRRDAADS
ncbi:MAG: mannose-1-phosphate guanylyltransferase/mannose-6-phosphate isomerase, partial [Planctomycetota bacterium]